MKTALRKISAVHNFAVYRNSIIFLLGIGISALILYVLINSPA
jgi:hypothetical protein